MGEWMNAPWVQDIIKLLSGNVARLAEALGVLVGGWIIALMLRRATFAAMTRTTIDNKLATLLGFKLEENRLERVVARTVYYATMAMVLVAFFHVMRIDAVTTPLITMLNSIAKAVPSLMKAAVLAFCGFVAATALRRVIIFVLGRAGFDRYLQRFADEPAAAAKADAPSGDDDEPAAPPARKKGKKDAAREQAREQPSVARTMGDVVYWFVLTVTAIPVFEALEIGALARPLSSALETITTYLPKVGAAVVLMIIGFVLSRAVRTVVAGVLGRIGIDRLIDRLGVSKALRGHALSGMVGTAAMGFVLLHFTISAVGRLQIDEISAPLGQVLHQIYSFLPRLLVGSLLMTIGVLVSRVVGNIGGKFLAAMGYNTLLAHIGLYKESAADARAQDEAARAELQQARDATEDAAGPDLLAPPGKTRTPADVAGMSIGVVVVLLFLRQVLSVMQLEGMAQLVDGLLQFLPHLLVALVVMGAGMWAGRWANTRIDEVTANSPDAPMRTLGPVVRGVITTLSVMVALQQLGVARQLIAIAFAAVLGAICLALALAFGLGGREVANKILTEEYDRRKRNRGAQR
jgi:hypothetical protein